MKKQPDDIVTRFIERAREMHPETAPAKWDVLGSRLRMEFGGERVYVWKPLQATKGEQVAALLAQGVSLREARRRVGASPMTAWRALSLRWSTKS